MTGQAVCLVAICAAAGGAVGWLFVPRAADLLLKRVHRRACAWWWDSYRAYRAFKRANPLREPSPSAPGEEGALGVWHEDALHAARVGLLPIERARALGKAGTSSIERLRAWDTPQPGRSGIESRSARTEAQQERRCSFAATPRRRAACAVACASAGGALPLSEVGAPPCLLLALCGLAMAVAVVCDLRARVLPLECCAVIAAAGAAFQASVAGLQGLATGVALGAVVVMGCLVVNRLFGKFGASAVGQGDVRCMAALSVASGAAAPLGLAACYVVAGAFALVGLACGRLSMRAGMPMGPFLAVWLVCGACVLAVA